MKNDRIIGLTSQEVRQRQEQYGKNELALAKKESFLVKVIHILKEPMFVLLIVAATIYFILNEPRDGAIMSIFVVVIISIELIQEWKTDKTLAALKNLSQPKIEVLRDGTRQMITSDDLVPGDIMYLSEGDKIPADGRILVLNDLCVDESSLTGESQGVWKALSDEGSDYWKGDHCYASTFVVQGSATIEVVKTGVKTEYGKIGLNISQAKQEPSPLDKQTAKLIKTSTIIAIIFFGLAVLITFINLVNYEFVDRLIASILSGVTLAMAMIPEEFPVIFTVFLSMGAWRLAQKKALVRKLPAVETLGAISVLCVDKTGTITKNQMEVSKTSEKTSDFMEVMGLACEKETYDPMEYALLDYCERNGFNKEEQFARPLISEYSFTNELKMMGHIWQRQDDIIISAKGSLESLLPLIKADDEQKEEIKQEAAYLAQQGLRVLGVAKQVLKQAHKVPETILDCQFELCGLVGLVDPPREGIKEDIKRCLEAGIKVVMITGDNGETAGAIAYQVGIPDAQNVITGDQLSQMDDTELSKALRHTSIFSRVLPEHKMRIIKAFKANGEVVAMTGDGVNDAPALKYADIGVAMGKNGSEVSREAADLILLDDNFTTIVKTISDGRRIYDNIKKAIGYVFTIHIPIALAALWAPLLGIHPSSLLLLPTTVVLLELVIDPTCSIVLEREPAEENIMDKPPRKIGDKLLTKSLLGKSILQGIAIFFGSFLLYYFNLKAGVAAPVARTMGLVALMIANIFLVQVISSDYNSIFTSLKKLSKDKLLRIVNVLVIIAIIVIVYTPLNSVLGLASLNAKQLLIAIGCGFVSVIWYEFVKMYNRSKLIKG